MPRFTIPFSITVDGEFTVDADSVEDARALVAKQDVARLLAASGERDVDVSPAEECSETPDAELSGFELVQFEVTRPAGAMTDEAAVEAAKAVLAEDGYPVTGEPEFVDFQPEYLTVLLRVGGGFWEDLERDGSYEADGHGVTVGAETA